MPLGVLNYLCYESRIAVGWSSYWRGGTTWEQQTTYAKTGADLSAACRNVTAAIAYCWSQTTSVAIVPSFRGLWCVDCQVVSDPDCEPGEGDANHLRCVDPVAQGLSHRDCPICGAESGEPHNWDVHNAEARA